MVGRADTRVCAMSATDRCTPPQRSRREGLAMSKSGQAERGRTSPTGDGYGQAIAVLDDHDSAGHPLALHRTGVAIAPRRNDAPLHIVTASLGGALRRHREGCGGKLVEADPASHRVLGFAMR